jgi:hypothetical protein
MKKVVLKCIFLNAQSKQSILDPDEVLPKQIHKLTELGSRCGSAVKW